MKTMLLVPQGNGVWDLTVDTSGNIAVATNPYSLAQNAASAIKTVLGEVWYDTTIGIPWNAFLGKPPNIALLRAKLIAAALSIPEVVSAQVFFTSFSNRTISGQVQVTDASTGLTSAAAF